MTLRIGTRRSALAMAQTSLVADMLRTAHPHLKIELVPIVTRGDRNPDVPIAELGTKELWTAELSQAIDDGRVDLAVHSAKDLPTTLPPSHTIACTPERYDPADALICDVADTIDALPYGAVVGSSSLRRAAQLLAHRPDLTIEPIRGNVETRIRKVRQGDYHATLLALAGLARAGLAHEAAGVIPIDVMLPAPGQAVLAIEAASQRDDLADILAAIHHGPTHHALTAERALVTALGVGCRAPLAALAHVHDNQLTLTAALLTPDGNRAARSTRTIPNPADDSPTTTDAAIDALVATVVADLNAQGAADILADLPT